MDKLNTYFTIIFIIFALILFGLLILNYVKQQKLMKALIVNKFSLSALVESSVSTNKKSFVILAKNKSMNDVTISSLGITIGLNHFDFLDVYKLQNNISSENVVINPRSYIKLSLSLKNIELLVKNNLIKTDKNDIDSSKGKIQKIGVFITDCAGNTVNASARSFYKVIKADKKNDILGEEKVSEFIMSAKEYDGKEKIANKSEDKVQVENEECEQNISSENTIEKEDNISESVLEENADKKEINNETAVSTEEK